MRTEREKKVRRLNELIPIVLAGDSPASNAAFDEILGMYSRLLDFYARALNNGNCDMDWGSEQR